MESKAGQSIGKILLHIKTTNLEGKQADTKSIAISSFGKAFLLPLDVLLGWIFTNDKRQRLLSRAANTIVIKAHDSTGSETITYKKDCQSSNNSTLKDGRCHKSLGPAARLLAYC